MDAPALAHPLIVARLNAEVRSPVTPDQSDDTEPAGRRVEGVLDLHEGIGDPLHEKPGCKRAAEHLNLLNCDTGELVRTRCRATRKCDYCGKLGAVENAEMVALDALEHAPTLFVV